MFVKGDKIIAKKEIFNIPVGEIFEITSVENDLISFEKVTEYGKITSTMSTSFIEEYFEKYVEEIIEKEPIITTITEEDIDLLIDNSEFETCTTFDKCTIVSCKLPNGFVITESSACVTPENYNEDMGIEICLEKIKNKVWELEGYRLQCELYFANATENEDVYCENECEDCDCMACLED